jgi:tight adherence protein B
MPALIALVLFAAVLLAGYAAFSWLQQSQQERDALRQRLKRVTRKRDEPDASVQLLRDERLSNIPLLNTILLRTPSVLPLVRMIRQAGLRRRVGEVILYIPLLFLIGFLLTMLLGLSWYVALLVGLVLAMIPVSVVSRLRSKRLLLFRDQLPEALDLIRSALQAGHGLIASMSVASETLPDPVATELRYVVDETRLGLPLRDALYHLSDRVGDPNVPILIVGVLVAQEVGGNLTEVIDNTAYTIRERSKLQREVRTLTAQSRYSGVLLTALPVLVGSFMFFFNPTYFDVMITKTVGHYLLASAVGMILIGHLFMQRILKSVV